MNDEPKHFSEFLKQNSLIMEGYPTQEGQPHPNNGNCSQCGWELEQKWRNAEQYSADGRLLAKGWWPVLCCDACYEKHKAGRGNSEENERIWNSLCPVEFRKPWDGRIGDDRLLAKVLAFNYAAKRGMMVHGASGRGKTRAVWQLLKRLLGERIEFLWLDPTDFEFGGPKEAERVQLLVLDDLGHTPLGQRQEAGLLRLISRRCDWHRPVIVTTQHTGDSLEGRFSEGTTAKAVIRRLREYCDGIPA
jgi:hypothetical protein